jgi:hypothetical protein
MAAIYALFGQPIFTDLPDQGPFEELLQDDNFF